MARRAVHNREYSSGGGAGGPRTPSARRAPWPGPPAPAAFTLPELLIVIGIVGVLAAILLPLVGAARREARRVQCLANVRSLGQALLAYAGENQGWLYPVDRNADTGKLRLHFGTVVPPHQRWPAIVFKLYPGTTAPPLPYDPSTYTGEPYEPETFPAAPYTPELLFCPEDDPEEVLEAHSYVLNGHLGQRGFRLGDKDLGGRTPDAVILAGEKVADERDYYLQSRDFPRVAEPFRHGEAKGSNYLFVDGHAETQLPRDILRGIDPWDVDRGK